MIDKAIIKRLIVEYQQIAKNKKLLQRKHQFDVHSNYVLVGIRRAGKSFLLFQDVQQKIRENVFSENDFIYLNFEDERLTNIQVQELDLILECFKELYPEKQPWLYLDEIQLVEGWDRFSRRIADQGYRVMITGSNAKMLSNEIAATLGGRYIPHEVFLFSFKEFLEYKNVKLTDNWQFDRKKTALIRNYFDEYFCYGGFAENFDREDKREWLNALYQKILLGDIIARNAVRTPRVFRLLARKIAESIQQPMSQTRLHNVVISTGENISLPVMKDYLDYMHDAFLIFSVPNLSSPLSERATTLKRYFADNGLLNLFFTSAEEKLLENIVAITLFQKYYSAEESQVFYYNKNIEIDFCIPKEKLAIQVALNMNDSVTYEREVSALEKFIAKNNLYKGIIITLDEERTIKTSSGNEFNVIPVWKWIL